MNEVLMVFVKNRAVGKVKTRLAADIGDLAALNVYEQLLNYTRRIVEQSGMNIQVWFSDRIPDKSDWRNTGAGLMQQSGNDLGERMSEAFRHNFESGAAKVIVIGSDCAELTSDHIRKAGLLLNDHDLVVGPARDGGYYLMAMKEFHPELFEQIDWSTESVLKQTIMRAEDSDLRVILLDELNDVDELEDWNEVRHRFE